MDEHYLRVINESPELLYTLPHKHVGAHPTGFVVITDTLQEITFSFSICPLYLCKTTSLTLPGSNPHDVIFHASNETAETLERSLYSLWEHYKEKACESTTHSMKRYLYEKTLPPRKIVIPCFKRLENLEPVLKRFEMIEAPKEGFKPQILLVEHSPYPEMELIARKYNCEWIWIFLDVRTPFLPFGQFNKALAYDKAFIYGTPASWYLFHDNDVLVPNDFWSRLDANVKRSGTQFIQPYTHRCLICLKPEAAEEMRKDLARMDTPIPPEDIYELVPGAPGGSLYITRQRYLEVGGHDPTLSWGYGPEDSMFWDKLQTVEPIAYADEPPIELVHLWHPSSAPNNPLLHQMNWFVKVFFANKTLEEKKAYMGMKRLLLETLLNTQKPS